MIALSPAGQCRAQVVTHLNPGSIVACRKSMARLHSLLQEGGALLYNIMASCVKLFRLGRPDCSNPADAAEPCCSGPCRALQRMFTLMGAAQVKAARFSGTRSFSCCMFQVADVIACTVCKARHAALAVPACQIALISKPACRWQLRNAVWVPERCTGRTDGSLGPVRRRRRRPHAALQLHRASVRRAAVPAASLGRSASTLASNSTEPCEPSVNHNNAAACKAPPTTAKSPSFTASCAVTCRTAAEGLSSPIPAPCRRA